MVSQCRARASAATTLVCWAALGACSPLGPASQQSAAPMTSRVSVSALGPGDVFEVRVFGEDDLSTTYRVASDGTINFPLVGQLSVDGRTANQVSALLAERLATYIKKPSVSIFVKEYNSKKVYVFGEVRKPGTFPFEDGMNIVQAITLAGGFEKFADQKGTFVTRIIDGREKRSQVSVKAIGEGQHPNFQLRPGDIVYVPESLF